MGGPLPHNRIIDTTDTIIYIKFDMTPNFMSTFAGHNTRVIPGTQMLYS